MGSRSRSRDKSRKKEKSSKKDHKKRDRSRSRDRKSSHKDFKHKRRDYLEDKYDRRSPKNEKSRQRSRSRSNHRDRDRNNDKYKDKYNNNNHKGLSHKERKIQQRERDRQEDEEALKRYREKQKRERDNEEQNERNKNNKKQEKNRDGQDNQEQDAEQEKEKEEVEKPNFEATGILTAEQNTVNGAVLKFTEPQDAAEPSEKWRIYCYKGKEELPTVHLRNSSVFLFGKDLRIADIQLLNNSCSGQHAVIQFREKRNFDEMTGEYNSQIIPYLMDLESTNGTKLNGQKVEGARYYQLFEKDLLQFGFSDREYLLMKVPQ